MWYLWERIADWTNTRAIHHLNWNWNDSSWTWNNWTPVWAIEWVAWKTWNLSWRFSWASVYINIPHNTNLNVLPLTIKCIFKTSANDLVDRWLYNKYYSWSANWYTIWIYNWVIYCWYYASWTNNIVFSGADWVSWAIDWKRHSFIFTLDSSWGQTYLDWRLIKSKTWNWTAAATTSTQGLSIWRYPWATTQYYIWDIDECVIENKHITPEYAKKYHTYMLWRFGII